MTQQHNFSITLKEGSWEIKVSPATRYGYFEHADGGEGGLWFEGTLLHKPAGPEPALELYDYDGFSYLPKAVATALRKAGFIVGPEFD